jgi:late competence protein required for DNA uptake (superfamily II DNA/RNA helicase)
VIGRNDRIAWGITNVGTDVQVKRHVKLVVDRMHQFLRLSDLQDLFELDQVDVDSYRHNGVVKKYKVIWIARLRLKKRVDVVFVDR